MRSARAFTAYSKAPKDDPVSAEEAFEEIVKRSVVPEAINTDTFPGERFSHFSIVPLTSMPEEAPPPARSARKRPPEGPYSNHLVAASTPEVSCNRACLRASETLSLTEFSGHSGPRLVLADSGFNADLRNMEKLASATGRDYSDADQAMRHGTFNLKEITTPLGPVPPQALALVKVGRQAKASEQDSSGGAAKYVWDMETLERSIRTVNQRAANPTSTWIFNISAAGAKMFTINLYGEASRVLFIVAAGNDGQPNYHGRPYAFATDQTPDNNVLVVGALDQNGIPFTAASYSNRDPDKVDLFAPGSCVCGSDPQNNGTSQAAPLVSAAAFALASEHPQWPARYLKWRLISTSDLEQDLDSHPKVAVPRNFAVGGVLNVVRARRLNPVVITSADRDRDIEVTGFQFPCAGENPWLREFVNEGSSDLVLRLHRVRCGEGIDMSWACFERFVINSPVDPPTHNTLLKSMPLRLVLADGSGSKDLTADDILDIIFPVDYDTRKRQVPTVPR